MLQVPRFVDIDTVSEKHITEIRDDTGLRTSLSNILWGGNDLTLFQLVKILPPQVYPRKSQQPICFEIFIIF